MLITDVLEREYVKRIVLGTSFVGHFGSKLHIDTTE